jgi:hypothetical protein
MRRLPAGRSRDAGEVARCGAKWVNPQFRHADGLYAASMPGRVVRDVAHVDTAHPGKRGIETSGLAME